MTYIQHPVLHIRRATGRTQTHELTNRSASHGRDQNEA
jgi:hypothetical protein